MPKNLGLAIAAGLASAVLFLAVLSGSAVGLLSTYVAPLPLLSAGLSLGTMAVVVAAAVGAVAAAFATGGVAWPYLFAVAVPAVLVVRQALLSRRRQDDAVEWYPPGLLLGWLFGAVCLATAVATLYFAGEPEGFPGAVEQLVGQAVETLGRGDSPGEGLTPQQREQLTALWVPFLPAMVGASWVLMTVLNGVLAQGGLVRMGRNRRPSPAYAAVVLPDWVAWGLLVGAVLAMLAEGSLGYAARNVAVLLLVAYVFPGLAWIHGALRSKANGRTWLALFYGVFFVAFGWAVIVVAGLGLIRHWMTLGRKWVGSSQEED